MVKIASINLIATTIRAEHANKDSAVKAAKQIAKALKYTKESAQLLQVCVDSLY